MGALFPNFSALVPQPATSAPPPVQTDSAKGAETQKFALADHTHESRLQARRVQVTPNAQGRAVYTFPRAYDAGVVPIVQAIAETPTGVAYRNDVSIIEGSTTNTQVTLLITRLNQGLTVAGLGIMASIFAPVTTPVWLHVMSRAPST